MLNKRTEYIYFQFSRLKIIVHSSIYFIVNSSTQRIIDLIVNFSTQRIFKSISWLFNPQFKHLIKASFDFSEIDQKRFHHIIYFHLSNIARSDNQFKSHTHMWLPLERKLLVLLANGLSWVPFTAGLTSSASKLLLFLLSLNSSVSWISAKES